MAGMCGLVISRNMLAFNKSRADWAYPSAVRGTAEAAELDMILEWICTALESRLTYPIGAPRFWPSSWAYVCALSCSGYVVRLMAQASLATRVSDTRPNTLDHRAWYQSFWVGARKCIPVSEDP